MKHKATNGQIFTTLCAYKEAVSDLFLKYFIVS